MTGCKGVGRVGAIPKFWNNNMVPEKCIKNESSKGKIGSSAGIIKQTIGAKLEQLPNIFHVILMLVI